MSALMNENATYEVSDEERDVFREHVLNALDVAAKKVFFTDHGWTDNDLPDLFKALDDHLARLVRRDENHTRGFSDAVESVVSMSDEDFNEAMKLLVEKNVNIIE